MKTIYSELHDEFNKHRNTLNLPRYASYGIPDVVEFIIEQFDKISVVSDYNHDLLSEIVYLCENCYCINYYPEYINIHINYMYSLSCINDLLKKYSLNDIHKIFKLGYRSKNTLLK